MPAAAGVPVTHPMQRLNQNRTLILLVAPATLFLVVFFAVPLVYLLGQSVIGEAGLTLTGYVEFFTKRTSQIIYWRTLRMAFFVTLICLLLGYPASFVLARMPVRRRSLLLSLVILPLMTNSVARTYAWLVILGRNGVLNESLEWLNVIERPIRLIYTEEAILIGLSQLFLPLMVLPLVSAMENIPDDVIEAARGLGANAVTAFWRVVVPMSADGLVLGATLVFTGSVTAFVTPTLLGGTRTLLLSTLLNREARVLYNTQAAAVVAVVMIVTTLAVNILLRVFRRAAGTT